MTDSLPFAPQSPSGPDDTPLEVLLIEDNPGDARLFEEYVAESPTQATIRHEQSVEAGLRALKAACPDVLVTDLGLPDSEGAETVKTVAAAAPEVPIVVLTGQEDLQAALEAQKAGATEYLQKSELGPALVGRTLRWAAQRHRLQAKLRQRDAWIRSITEGLSAGVFRTGPTGRIEYANEALAEMLGGEHADDLVGRDLTTFYVDPLQKGRMLATEGADDMEIRFEGRNGSEFVGLLSAKATYDADGNPIHYDGTVTDVTGRVRTKEKLRMLSEAVEQSKEAVVITEANPLDEPGPRIEYVNPAYEEMTGYAKEELIGKTPRLLQGPKTDREVIDSLRSALETGEEWEGETINYRKDGEPYQVQWNVAPVRNGDDELEHWVSVQRNVTERRERERELREKERQLEQIRENVKDVVWISTPGKDAMEFISDAYEEVWGRTTEELQKDPMSFVRGIHPDDRERVRAAMEVQTKRPEAYEEIYRIIRPNGEVRWIHDRAAGAYGEDGRLKRIVGVATDITEKKKRELELKTTNTRLKLALQSTNTGTFDWDIETDEVIWDEASERLFGYEPNEFPNTFQAWADRVHPEDLREAEQKIERAIQQEEIYDVVFRVDPPGEEIRWIRARGDVGYDEDGTATRMIGIHTDVTDQKRRERELLEAKEEAERMSRLKSAFLANMSHEIRTPLTSILGFAEAIGGEVEKLQQTNEVDLSMLAQFSSLIERSGRRLMETLTGVLNLSKLQAGEMNFSLGPVDLTTEAEEAVQELGPQAQSAGIDLKVETGNEPVWTRADEGGLQIALRNLISNAIKYTEEGGEVRVRVRQEGSMSAVEVGDTGIGMDPEKAQRLFEAFKQASEGVGRVYEGTGLGLTVTKEVLGQMGGSVEVETEKGKGSRFTIRLPHTDAPEN